MNQIASGVLSEFQQQLHDQWETKFEENFGMSPTEHYEKRMINHEAIMETQQLFTKEEIEQRMEEQKYNEVLHDINALEKMSYLGNRNASRYDRSYHDYSDGDHCYY